MRVNGINIAGPLSVRLLAPLMLAFFVAAPAWAGDIPAEVQVRLQGAMQQHIDEVSVDGAYTFIDPATRTLRTVYPANVHPMVLPFGSDYFVCSALVDESGAEITADFLVRKVGDRYRVVQTILGDRPMVEEAMAKLGG